MLETILPLEKRLNLDSVRLFLNPFDITDAFLSVFRADQISKILEDTSKYKVYKKIVRLLSSDGMREYMRQLSKRSDDRVFHRLRRFAFFQDGNEKRNSALQLMFYQMISRPMIYRDTDKDEFKDTRVRELAEQYKETIGEAVLTRRKKELIAICYDALSAFCSRVESNEFAQFQHYNFEQYQELFQGNFAQEMQEKDQGSAFALYLLANPDVRINLLSQYFVQRDVAQVMENFELIDHAFGEKIEDLEEVRSKVQMSIDHGNKLLQLFSLQQESMFQFPEELGVLLEKSAKGHLFLKSDYDQKTREYDSRINEVSERLRRQGERLEEVLRDKQDLAQKLEDAGVKIHLLETTPPEIDHSEEYRKLERLYRELEGRVRKSEADLKRSEDEVQRVRGKNKEFSEIIDEKIARVRELEGELNKTLQELEEFKLIPRLKKYCENRSVLMICGIDQAFDQYKLALEKVFGLVEVVKQDQMFRQTPAEYDLFIMGTGSTRHGDRLWAEKQIALKKSNTQLIVYPLRPNQLLQFLFEQYLPKEYRNDKKGK